MVDWVVLFLLWVKGGCWPHCSAKEKRTTTPINPASSISSSFFNYLLLFSLSSNSKPRNGDWFALFDWKEKFFLSFGWLWLGTSPLAQPAIPLQQFFNCFRFIPALLYCLLIKERRVDYWWKRWKDWINGLIYGWMRERMKLSEMPVKPITNCGAIKR